MALLRDHVHEHRAVAFERDAEHLAQGGHVVAVDGGRAGDAELLEDHRVRNHELLHRFLHVAAQIDEPAREEAAGLHGLLEGVARLPVFGARAQIAQMAHEGAHGLGDGHAVVVEDDDHAGLILADMVEGLEGHTARERRIAYHGNDVVGASLHVAGFGKAHSDRKAVGSMSRRMGVVRTFVGVGKTGEAVELAQGLELVAATGEKLVGISLMAHIENDLVIGAVEQRMQGNDDFHGAKARSEVTARLRGHLNHLFAQFPTEDLELIVGKALHVGRALDHIEYPLSFGHSLSPSACA